MTERDPRIDPRPGDVLRKGGVRREVRELWNSGGMPMVAVVDGGWINRGRSKHPTINMFRKWAAKAFVENCVSEHATPVEAKK